MVGVPSISEGVRKDRQLPNGALEGRNDFGKIGYNGPCPPKGGPHRYFFKLYALDARTNLKTATNKSDLERAVGRATSWLRLKSSDVFSIEVRINNRQNRTTALFARRAPLGRLFADHGFRIPHGSRFGRFL
jgi:hypothetical protein